MTEINDSNIRDYILAIHPDWKDLENRPKNREDIPREVRHEIAGIVKQLYLLEKETDKFYSEENKEGFDKLYNFLDKAKDIYAGRHPSEKGTYHDPPIN